MKQPGNRSPLVSRRRRPAPARRRLTRSYVPHVELLEVRETPTAGAFLQGTAYVDANHSHALDAGDSYLSGASIALYQGSTATPSALLATTTTNATGAYLFSDGNVITSYGNPGLNPGTYTLVETPPAGYANDSSQVLSQINSATAVNAGTIQVTIADPSQLYVSYNGKLFFSRNAWDFLKENFVYSGAGVTHNSNVVTLSNTGVLNVGDTVTVQVGTTKLSAKITAITPNTSITLASNWTGSTSNSATVTDTDTESAGQDPVAAGFGSFTQQSTGAGVTNGSAKVTLSNTGSYAVGQIVRVTDGTSTLYSTIASINAGSSIILVDAWRGNNGSAAAVSTLPTGNGFLSLCWDLQHFLLKFTSSTPGTNLFQVTPTSGQGSPANAGRIAYLYNHYGTADIKTLSGTDPNTGLPRGTPAQAVGLQVAIWELEYGSTFQLQQVLQLASGNTNTAAQELSQINTWANFYVNDSLGKSEVATFLQVNGTVLQLGSQGMIATGSYDFGNQPNFTPSISTTPGGTVVVGSGATLTDTATLSGGSNPTGSITFTLYAPDGTTVVDTETVSVNGDGNYSTPNGYLPQGTGTYNWVATYSGDGTNNSVTSPFGSEPEGVSPAGPKITTDPGDAVILGSGAKLTDSATLSGGFNPTGSITFTLYAPDGTTVVDTETVTVSGNNTYTTPAGYLPASAGTYQWVASYSGDANNKPAQGNVGDEPEAVLPTTPAITTNPGPTVIIGGGVKLTDSATLSGAMSPTGSITFTLYAPDGTTVVDTETVTVNGNNTYTTPAGYLPTETGTYNWVATYSGDTNNNPASNTFGDEPEGVSAASPDITTNPGGTVILGSGAKLTDSATLSGGFNPTGSITFTLYAPDGTTVVDTETVTVSGNNTYTTPAGYLPASAGTYQWVASYSGDANNNPAQGKPGDEPEAVSPASPTLVTTSGGNITLGNGAVTLTDTADLEGAYNPGGSITFTLSFNGNPVPAATQTVTVTANGTYSASYLLPMDGSTVAGTYVWHTHYSPDANNNAADDQGVTLSDTREQQVVTPASPSITTVQSPASVTLDGSGTSAVLTDTATLSGGYNPQGTITFTLYDAGDNIVDTESVPVSGNGSYSTPVGYTLPTTGSVTGTYQWVASYSDDGNNSRVTSGEGDEPVTVGPATPAITTTPSPTSVTLGTSTVTLKDTAQLSGGYSPTGIITFTLVAPGGATADTETVTVSGNGSYTTPTGYTLPTTSTVTGTYQWNAVFTDSSGNNTNAADLNDKSEQTTVSPASPSITTSASETAGGVVGSAVLSDSATIWASYFGTGTITFTLTAPDGTTSTVGSVTVASNGTYYSPTVVATQVGTYTWHATYFGDGNNNGAIDDGTNESLTTVKASPSISTSASETTGGVVGSAVLSDSATLSGSFVGSGTITFTLTAPDGSTSTVGTVNVSGDNTYASPTVTATEVGTYTWHASYSGDALNSGAIDNGSNESLTTVKASPGISTSAGETAGGVIGSAVLSDAATITGGYNVSSGSITFTLTAPDGTTSTIGTVTVTGTGTYNSPSVTATEVGTYTWHASYSGDALNNGAVDNGTNESATIIKASPAITTTPTMTPGSNGVVIAGEFATIGFWHNKNGQAVITSFNGGSTSTALGNWLANTYPNLFGASNPYTGTSLAGLTNAQVAQVYLNLWTPSGLTKNTYVQAFAVALGVYADTTSLGGQSLVNNGLAGKYGFVVSAGGGGSATFNVGGDGAAFGVANGTSLTVAQVLTIVNNNFSPSTGTFYSGDQTKTSGFNDILDGINSVGDIPGSGSNLNTSGGMLLDSATLSGGYSPTGSITFYLFAPGVTPNGSYSNNVYSDTVTVSGNGNYNVLSGANPGGYLPSATGTYQWVAVYSGDGNNNTVLSPFGSEPFTVGAANATISTIPGGTVVIGSGSKLTDQALLAAAVNPTGTITFYLFAPGVTPNSSNSNNVYSDVVTVSGNGTYSTATGPNPGGYLPTATGTYVWLAVYSGDANNAGASDTFGDEPETVTPSGPTLTTQASAGGTVNTVNLSDTAKLSGGYNETGTITFTLTAPNGKLVTTETVTVSGNGTYTTPTSVLATQVGIYTWSASYSGDANNQSATDNGQNETTTITSGSAVGAGQFATIGFWKNKNGQAVINSFDNGPSSTNLGNWMATTYPNLFGNASNVYTHTSLAGLTNAQIASVYANLWTPNGVTKNTYVQAFAVALGEYASTTSLGGASLVANGLAAKYGFKVSAAGGYGATWTIGKDSAAFGGQTGALPVYQVLQIVDQNFNPATGLFFGGDQTLTSAANDVLNGINTAGDIKLVTDQSTLAIGSIQLLGGDYVLAQGTLNVYVDNSAGNVTSDEQADIDAAVATYNTDLAPYGVSLVEVGADQADNADITIQLADTTDIGGVAEGVLGVTEMGGQITLVSGWNFYTGSDPNGIGADQYDFQSVATHELGHALGLGHSTDSGSVMYPYLGTGQIHRDLTTNDLSVIDTDESGAPEPLRALPEVHGDGPILAGTASAAGQRLVLTSWQSPSHAASVSVGSSLSAAPTGDTVLSAPLALLGAGEHAAVGSDGAAQMGTWSAGTMAQANFGLTSLGGLAAFDGNATLGSATAARYGVSEAARNAFFSAWGSTSGTTDADTAGADLAARLARHAATSRTLDDAVDIKGTDSSSQDGSQDGDGMDLTAPCLPPADDGADDGE